jgi:hypothetical protein
MSDEYWPEDISPSWGSDEIIFLPPELLEQIAATDVPVGVPIGVGIHTSERSVKLFWEGRLLRNEDGSFQSVIFQEISPKYWGGAIGARFYVDLLHKCIQSMVGKVHGLAIEEFDDEDDVLLRLIYSFPVHGVNLGEIFDKALQVQGQLELPANQVHDDVMRALARSADRVLQGHYANAVELVARVDSAKTSADKGASLELLMESLFAQVPGFVVYERDRHTATEELDLVVINDSKDPAYSKDGPVILVECKNWTNKSGRPEYSQLETKMRNRHNRCTIAFFISWSGFTETISRETIRLSRENYLIVCLTGNDIRHAALAGNFSEFLRKATIQALTT